MVGVALGFEFATGLRVDQAGSESAIATTTEDTAILQGVGVVGVCECVDWFDVVDGVSFAPADGAGGVFFEELFADAFVGGGVVGGGGVFGHDRFFLTPLRWRAAVVLLCVVKFCAVIAPRSFEMSLMVAGCKHQWTVTIRICEVWTLYASSKA